VVRSENDLPAAVHEVYRSLREGHHVVAVVSACGDTTDRLTQRAYAVCNQPNEALLAALLATGEAASSALLGLALNQAGIVATVLDAEKAGLCTAGATLDSNLVSVSAANIFAALQRGVVVLPGFVGRGKSGETTLLGRGGSDLTALFLAERLRGVCRLVKDVDGLYTSDPNSRSGPRAHRFTQVSYRTATRVGAVIVQPKAVSFAEKHRLRFFVSAISSHCGTEVGPFADQLELQEPEERVA
jgi:homoserine dehydrogenase